MIIEINDFDGIISLVNSDTYKTFVDENWELEQLKQHFIDQMNTDSIIVWQTNNYGGSYWKVNIETKSSEKINCHSEFTKSITVTNGKLYLADYTDLTMAAQFEDNGIPAEGNENQFFEIENGTYNVNVKRLFNPDEEVDEQKVNFEISLEKIAPSNKVKIDKLFWWTF